MRNRRYNPSFAPRSTAIYERAGTTSVDAVAESLLLSGGLTADDLGRVRERLVA